ncbi:hypothetical protein, partial [uncultured Sphingomonas sp.]|uniref:hypothetical protein n=1 Tax=uncultured Sphingomonas sp. TaxID=158754 RepID=UPI0035C9BFB9
LRQPRLSIAVAALCPRGLAVMQIKDIKGDLYAIADGYAESLFADGCTEAQALSAKWGGVSAIGKDFTLFQGWAKDFDDAVAESGRGIADPKVHVRMKYRAAATLHLSTVLADAPGEYERFLRHIGK